MNSSLAHSIFVLFQTNVMCSFVLLSLFLMTQWIPMFLSEECNFFHDVTVEVAELNGRGMIVLVVNGCLEPSQIGNREITEIYITSQNKPHILGKDSVRNLSKLETLRIHYVNLKVLEPQAFKDLPSLKKIDISRNSIEEIPKDVFNLVPSIEELWISNNKIDFIANQAFANLQSLKVVDATGNALECWNREWFNDSPNIVKLAFGSNKIRTIPRKAFASLTKLKTIYFENNVISNIQPGAFDNLENLDLLSLTHNRLTMINADVFTGLIRIGIFSLDGNYLNYLSDDLLEKITVDEIILNYNPWKCPCLGNIYNWIYRTKVKAPYFCYHKFVPVCTYSTSNEQTCLERIDKVLTRRYIDYLKTLSVDLGYCARLN